MILVDPRFGSERPGHRSSHRAVAEALPAFGVEVELCHLDAGDFSFLGNGPEGPIQIGVELKVISDLVNSMRSGRLKEQVLGMSERYGRSYLIVEGIFRASRRNGVLEVPRGAGWKPLMAGPRPVFWADIEKFITGLEEVGVRVRRTRTSHETAKVIAQVLASFWDKDYSDHTSLHGTVRVPEPMALVREDETTRRIRRVCQALGVGIGWGRSKAVAERFRSVYGLVTADASELEEIDGIGKTIARDAHGAIREEIAVSRVSARVVSPQRGAAARSPRDSGQRQGRRVDPARAPQRRVPAHRAGRRGAR